MRVRQPDCNNASCKRGIRLLSICCVTRTGRQAVGTRLLTVCRYPWGKKGGFAAMRNARYEAASVPGRCAFEGKSTNDALRSD